MTQLPFLLAFFSACIVPQTFSFRPKKYYKTQPRTQLGKKRVFLDKNSLIATTDNYKDLIERSNMFVDKSLFIKDLLMNTAQATVFTTPAGWGKTTCLNMLRTFFEFKLDSQYQIDRNTTAYDTYSLFVKGEITWTTPQQTLLTPFLISDHQDIIVRHFGRYPVIYLSFKKAQGRNWDEIWTGIRAAITEGYQQHAYMIHCFAMAIYNQIKRKDMMHKFQIDQRQFEIFLSGSETRRVPMRKSIRFLSEILHWYYRRQVLLLIDDFDAPLLNIFHYPNMVQKDITKLSSFMTDLYKETFRRNVHVKKSILTGTYCVENVTQFPTIVNQYNFITNPFPHLFGFTESELQKMFEHLQISSETLTQAADWYNGYRVGLKLSTRIYTPSSVIRYLNSRHFVNYYERRREFDILEHLIALKPLRFTFERLINYYEIPIPLPKLAIDSISLAKLRNIVHLGYSDDNFTTDLWQSTMGHLYGCGGLAAVSGEIFDNTHYIVIHTRVANRQIREEIIDKLFFSYHYEYGISADMVRLAVDQLAQFSTTDDSNSSQLTRDLRLVYHSYGNLNANERDPNSHSRTEQFLSSMLNYIVLTMQRVHHFRGQVYYESSKPDIVMWKDGRGVVIDVKFNTDYACKLLEQVKVYEDLVELFDRCEEKLETVKFIGIDVSPQNDVQICAQVRSISHS